MFSPPFGLGPVIYRLQDSDYQGRGEEQTFMIPVNMKFVVILMLHSTLSTVSCEVVGGSSGASSHFSLGIKKKSACVFGSRGTKGGTKKINTQLPAHLTHQVLFDEFLGNLRPRGFHCDRRGTRKTRYIPQGIYDLPEAFFCV
jgi:hypothetical protein